MRRLDLLDVLKVVRYPLFFLVVFAVFLVVLFPTDRLIPVLEGKLTESLGRQVIIGDLSLSVFGGVELQDVRIAIPRGPKALDSDEDEEPAEVGDEGAEAPEKEAAKPKRPLFYSIEEIDIDVSILSLALGELAVDVDLDIFGGAVSVSYEGPIPGTEDQAVDRRKLKAVSAESKKENAEAAKIPMKVRLEVEEVVLAQIFELRDKLPIPASGQISLAADLRSTTGKLSDLNGEVGLVVENLMLGQSGGAIEVGGMPLSLDPIVVNGLDLAIEVDDGLAEFAEFATRSPDIDLQVEGSMNFQDPIARSRFDFYVMFNIKDAYTKKSAVAKLLVTNLEQFSRDMKRAKRDDGYYGFRYRGTVRNIGSARFLAAKTFKKRGGRKDATRRSDRRAKSVRPKAGATPGGGASKLPPGSPIGGGFNGASPMRRRPAAAPKPTAPPEKQVEDRREVAEPREEVVESEMEFEEEEVADEEPEGGSEGSAEDEEPGDEGEDASGDEEVEVEE